MRQAKDKAPRKNTLSLSLEKDGTLSIWYQDEYFHGGYLKLPETADTDKEQEALEKMLSRLTKNTGVKIK